MIKPYGLEAEVFRYDKVGDGRHEIIGKRSCFVVIRLKGGKADEDDFTVFEDLTPKMAEFICDSINDFVPYR